MEEDNNLDIGTIDRYYNNFKGGSKQAVLAIQQKLVDYGYMSPLLDSNKGSSVDGLFGDQTKESLEAYNSKVRKKETPTFLFDNIPSTLEDKQCASGMCKILEMNNVVTENLGVKYKNAWGIYKSMEEKGNSTSIYNIYDDEAFKDVDENTSISSLKHITVAVKRTSQTKAGDYKIGDIVGLYWGGSEYHEETLGSGTHNTHIGFVSGVGEDGVPIITHNVGGEIRQQPYNQLVTTWIRRPNESSSLNSNYKSEGYESENIGSSFIGNLETKIERKLTDEEKGVTTNIPKLTN